MSQPPPMPPTARARFCTRCGAPLAVTAPRCAGCGAAVAGASREDRTLVLVILAVVLPFFCGLPTIGIVAAIAIPNFVRYQLRSKASEVPQVLGELVRSEAARARRGEGYAAFEPLPAGAPGSARRALSEEERALQVQLGWGAAPALYGQYRIAIARDEASGLQAASFCAETDLDEDGVRAAWVAFLPALRGGEVALAPPRAPCSGSAGLTQGADRYSTQPPGVVSSASPDSTF